MATIDHAQLKNAVVDLLSAGEFAWLTEKRWFGDKGKSISAIELADFRLWELAGVVVYISIVDVSFQNGEMARYFVPLMAEEPLEGGNSDVVLVDAIGQKAFGRWLVEILSSNQLLVVPNSWVVEGPADRVEWPRDQSALDSRPLGGEQSNSSVRVGEDAVVKILRRLQPGENPEVEILRALSGFDEVRVPSYLGSLVWNSEDGQQYVVAIAQTWVPNRGDGWAWILGQLRRTTPEASQDLPDASALRDLGVRTAEIHLALGNAPGEAFGVRVASAGDVARVQDALRDSSARARNLVSDAAVRLPSDIQARLPEVLSELSDINGLAAGFAVEQGLARIRVHGDYHLGQVLRTTDGDWTIIDFEGEPARSLDERRNRSSALRDVAGMLRSFAYVRAVAEQDSSGDESTREFLRDWEKRARGAFLDGYTSTIDARSLDAEVPLIPKTEAAFRNALAAWEADKALYEVAYEARNRPDWIAIPLQALIPKIFDQP